MSEPHGEPRSGRSDGERCAGAAPGGGRSTRYALATVATMTALGVEDEKPQGAEALLKSAGIEDVAIYPANPGMRYTGPIIAVDATHVVQQVAAHTYIAHQAARYRRCPSPASASGFIKTP